VKNWSTDELYVKLMEVVAPFKVVNDCAERVLGMITEYHINNITRSEDQKSFLYQIVCELRSRAKKTGEKKDLSKKIHFELF